MIRRISSSSIALLTASALLFACGGAPPGTGSAPMNGTRWADAANVAARTAEPRVGDVTAARPAPMSPTPGNTAVVASGSAAPPTAPGPDGPPEGATEGATEGASPATAKRDAAAPKTIGARHVLIQWMGSDRAPASVVRSRDQAFAVAKEVLRRARSGEDFARLAIEFSDEPGAGRRGGSLGRFGRGQMVGAFEATAFKLEVGEISDIVETPFGFHVIQRTE